MRIRIVSPSGHIEDQWIDAAKQRLSSFGHIVTEGRYARGSWGRFAATDEQRIRDLNEAFADPEVDAILCSRGGYGLQRILDRVKPTNKLVIGFSDITALHQLMHTIGVPSLHAIMCKHIATLPDDSPALRLFLDALSSFQPFSLSASRPFSLSAFQPLGCLQPRLSPTLNSTLYTLNSKLAQRASALNSRPGIARGVLIGGNLSVLYGLQGTPYALLANSGDRLLATGDRQEESLLPYSSTPLPPILFIEDISERHYHIDRMMQNLRMSGVLSHLGGLIVGQFTDCEQDSGMGETIYETILRAVEDYDYPVLFGFPAGHVEDNRPLWLGREIELEVTPCSSRISYI